MASHHFRASSKLLVMCVLLSASLGPVWAQTAAAPPAADPRDELITQLQAQLQSQEQKLQGFEQRLASAEQSDMNAARTEELKKQIREVLSEQEFRESLLPSTMQAGYDGGFYIKSSDGKFRLNFNALMQFRWTYYRAQHKNHYLLPRLARDDRSGFDMNRARLRFSGNAYSPDLTFAVELEQDSPDAYNTILSEGWVNYRFADELQFKAGYFRPATTRMQLMDNANMQFVDRCLVDAMFGAGYGMGVRLWGVAFNKRVEYYLDVLNSIADGERGATGRVITNDENRELDSNPAIAFRAVWHALGENPGADFAEDADIQFHQTPALDFGFHYMFNDDNHDVFTTRVPFPRRTYFARGGFGMTDSNGLQINQFGIDAAFKYMGFSATGEYIVRILDVRESDDPMFTHLYQFTGDGSTNAQHGAYVQLGYFLPIPGLEKKLEAVARVGGISTLSGGQEGTWEDAGGMNYYIQGNKVKLQADVTRTSEAPLSSQYSSLANVNDDALVFRMQLQVAF